MTPPIPLQRLPRKRPMKPATVRAFAFLDAHET